MTLPGGMDARTFVERHWQKEPLLVRGAIPDAQGLVDGDTLAGLACEDGVDARLVVADAAADTWSCEHGPFDEARFASLPASGWTLLVQAVDQWIPEVAGLLDRFGFLPRWRMDDVMVSYAADGGGVGPHFDHYDVFLIQAHGSRRWQLGQRCDAHSPLRDHPDLRLLAEFEAREDWLLQPGDMLYVPPGLAHRGTAVGGDCITCSVGFRAPSRAEIIQAAVDELTSAPGEHHRFTDAPASVDADPFLINEAALATVRAAWPGPGDDGIADALATGFGRLVTEPRSPDLIEPGADIEPRRIAASLAAGDALALCHHPCSRFAYRADGPTAVLFVDGEAYATNASVARGICHGRLAADDLTDDRTRTMVEALILAGSLSPSS